MAKKAAVQHAATDAAAPANVAATATTVQTPKLEDLVWMRDKFCSGLQNLESGVRELRLAYLNHFNSLLPENHPARLDPPFLFAGANAFGDATLPSSMQAGAAAGAFNAGAPGINKKRQRKPHDPNAPKRALTSYFLFMQANKPLIKAEHADWTASQISEESERRWANITPVEKERYEYMYNVDLARYYKQKEEYDAGRPIPEISSPEATRLYEEHLKTGNLIKGRKGRRVLDAAKAAGENVAAPADGVHVSSDEEDNEDETKPALSVEAAGDEDEDEDEAAAEPEDEDDSEEDEEEEEAPPPPAKKQKRFKVTPTKGTEMSKKKAESPEKEKKVRGKKGKSAALTEPEASGNSHVGDPMPMSSKKEKKSKKR